MRFLGDGSGLAVQLKTMSAKLDAVSSTWGEYPASNDYWEDFASGSAGWVANSRSPLPVIDGVARCEGPWVVDANHAPPGAGYLHLLMHIHTQEKHLLSKHARKTQMYSNRLIEEGGHSFIHGNHSRDMRDLRVRIRVRGNVKMRGARMTVLVQGQPEMSEKRANWVLTNQEFSLTEEWSDQEVRLCPEPSSWTFLGSRLDLMDFYGGFAPVSEILSNVNVSFIFVLFPLNIEPVEPVDDKHRLWAGRDYPVRPDVLPEGWVEFESVWFRYPDQSKD